MFWGFYSEPRFTLVGESGGVFLPDGLLLATANKNGIPLWNRRDGSYLATFASVAPAPDSAIANVLPPWVAFNAAHQYNGSVGIEKLLIEKVGETAMPANTVGLCQPELVQKSIIVHQ